MLDLRGGVRRGRTHDGQLLFAGCCSDGISGNFEDGAKEHDGEVVGTVFVEGLVGLDYGWEEVDDCENDREGEVRAVEPDGI